MFIRWTIERHFLRPKQSSMPLTSGTLNDENGAAFARPFRPQSEGEAIWAGQSWFLSTSLFSSILTGVQGSVIQRGFQVDTPSPVSPSQREGEVSLREGALPPLSEKLSPPLLLGAGDQGGEVIGGTDSPHSSSLGRTGSCRRFYTAP